MKELINLVKTYPVLYNTSHSDYAKKHLKDVIWQKIAEELNYNDGEEVRSVWLKLRNCHRDALRRKDIKSKSGFSTRHKTWKYERQMSFLLKYMIRSTSANQVLHQPPSLEDEEVQTEEFNSYYALNGNIGNEDAGNTDFTNEDVYKMLEPQVTIKRKRKKIKKTTIEDIIVRTLRKHEERDSTSKKEKDDLYHFYMSMYGMTKKLSMHRQLNLKKKIFDIVAAEQEEELLSDSTPLTPLVETSLDEKIN